MTSELTLNTKTIRLVLKMPRAFGFRMWLTTKLLLLAGFVAPITIQASIEHD